MAKWALFGKAFKQFKNLYNFSLEEKIMHRHFQDSLYIQSWKVSKRKFMNLLLSVHWNADTNMHSYLGIECIEFFVRFSVDYSKIGIEYRFLRWVTRNGFWKLHMQWPDLVYWTAIANMHTDGQLEL